MMLEIDNLHAGYRRLEILHGVNLSVDRHEIVSLIGANGAGKTTTLRALSGMVSTSGGRIMLDGNAIHGMRADRIVRAGLVHVAQDRALFGSLTVADNLEMGAYTQKRSGVKESLDQVYALFPILAERREQRADTMSGGQQQMLAIGRAMMSKPRVLTLDEPSVGLAPKLAAQVLEAIVRIRDSGVTVLIVEQNAAQALAISDRAYVIESGSIVLTGTGPELAHDERVKAAYLGI
ncbi:ABC transporter ATP-binding protein [Rhodococcus sp. IEGM 1401]|jgi:branched-chain amino acid transport system ATP-binding protein|uniref:ABC transporter ATP-binding protein n=1 Tax=Rhodococcus cerastii TaxID=908616 RepID=A0ABU4D5B7_9NOCA|nr:MULTISPECIES: ABC transporter ATP-binding protein [Rhodococcus]KZF09532.1 ABC transporter ATP-binding protein [Rhodococcus sp. EPR-147]KZF11641.1 ABC transporter ATP-binding protein [Rhodococcus sp. EPR-279]MCZ4561338.1 ABC transporter ATP-binding protein [Rhodococcus sp. IEGM 1401]MDI6626397.1 ABC transporter ATP-binding protein [Rhodococcus sp. (in: high G+C Gram-positive bacteria)]MDI9921534.1 ABC transporter ATP-binding protein [Rhodococcus sp. IEGM 1372]